ncbi:glycosyltransferase family 2 protein [Paenibacillus daejeonensis]|uniref:glycosyltransferase family 2 protein n=1 Tax=Paenibacillus daejeonensis TaxID=135193 RepID=UPI00037768C9|nr:glycosyltransferase family 2 protein [Paenibacillus daejeonensis]
MTVEAGTRVLIASPIRQTPDILERFLQSLKGLRTGNLELSYLFIDDNDDSKSQQILQQFIHYSQQTMVQYAASAGEYKRDENTHYWNEELVWKVATFKDSILNYARDMGFDYVFLIDSDLLLHPDTLLQLVSAEQPIVAEIFWTRWQPDAMPQPQVWMWDEYKQWEQMRGETLTDEQKNIRFLQFIAKLREPGLYEVGGLGACTLIRKDALHRGVSFRPLPNLLFWGEDRHFCIRAAALDLPLFVDTRHPAFHIYRETDLADADRFLREHAARPSEETKHISIHAGDRQRSGITLSMILRNEENRYLKDVLSAHRGFIEQAVIIDDGSTDRTVEICMQALSGIPVRIVHNAVSKFTNESELRQQQWQETIKASPEWILNLDGDEELEPRFAEEARRMTSQHDIDVYCFRLYDFWNDTHYREDEYWRAHRTYRPFLLRYRNNFSYRWKETPQHCGRFPDNVFDLPYELSDLRIKHYGWKNPNDRLQKLERYRQLDPDALYGWREQYESILDPDPRLIPWDVS